MKDIINPGSTWMTLNYLACILSLVSLPQAFAQKEKRIPLNEYGFEIKNKKQYTTSSYRTTLQESDEYRKEAVYDTLGQLHSISETWSTLKKRKWELERIHTTTFTPEGDTASVSTVTQTEKNVRLLFYENRELFAEAFLDDGRFREGWQLTPEGDRAPMSELRLIPRVVDMDLFFRHIAKEIRYPKEARQKGIQGVVYIAFDMDAAGSLTGMRVANLGHVEPMFQEEALRVIKSYPLAFEPKEDRYGNPMEGTLVLPVRFSL